MTPRRDENSRARLAALAEGLSRGDPRSLAKAISLAENQPGEGRLLLAELGEDDRKELTLGITGPTGVGKSTLIKALIDEALEGGSRVAVLAVDPSSPFSGGALLGDRFRMTLSGVPTDRLFIRSLSTRGNHGGLSSGVGVSAGLLKQAGYDVVLIETTGVGQCEVEIARMVDVVCVLLAEGFGDELQTMKSGLMEIADIFVVNKCRRPGTENLVRDLERHVGEAPRYRQPGFPPPPIVQTDALSSHGIDNLWRGIRELGSAPAHRDGREAKFGRLTEHRLLSSLLDRLRRRVADKIDEQPLNGETLEDSEARMRQWLLEACRERI